MTETATWWSGFYAGVGTGLGFGVAAGAAVVVVALAVLAFRSGRGLRFSESREDLATAKRACERAEKMGVDTWTP